MTVTFVGDSQYSIGDVRLDRAAQAFLAARAGCDVEAYVGPTVQVCVTGHVEAKSTELRSARRRRIHIVPEERFWHDVDCYFHGAERIDTRRSTTGRHEHGRAGQAAT